MNSQIEHMISDFKNFTFRAFDRLSQPALFWTTFFCIFVILFLQMAPTNWFENEIYYFDLARKVVDPESFTLNSAVFDDSAARIVSFSVLGLLIKNFGINNALVISRIITIVGFALAITSLAKAWHLSTAEVVIGLILFILLGQNYFAREWIFFGIEAKVFAYIAVIAGIASISRGLWFVSVIFLIIATYFHFLVGGFWAAAVLLLMAMQGESLPRIIRFGLLFAIAISPIALILLYERVILPNPDVSDLDLTLNQIYASFRNPHHVAPFLSFSTFKSWIPGISKMLAFTFLLFSFMKLNLRLPRPILKWLFVLHIYLIFAFIVVFFDRNTHVFAPFYLFRPNSLILLFLLFIITHWFRVSLVEFGSHSVTAIALSMVIIYAGPKLSLVSYRSIHSSFSFPAPVTFSDNDVYALIDWIKKETEPEAVIVLEETEETKFNTSWIAFERLIQRPTLVSWKFVPTSKADLAKWYRMIRWKETVFQGNCDHIYEYPVDYFVTINVTTLEQMAKCGNVLWKQGKYGILSARQGKMRRTG